MLDVRDLRRAQWAEGVESPWESVLRSKGTVWLDTHPRRRIQVGLCRKAFRIRRRGTLGGGDEQKSEIVIIGQGWTKRRYVAIWTRRCVRMLNWTTWKSGSKGAGACGCRGHVGRVQCWG